jgi:dipeptidase E
MRPQIRRFSGTWVAAFVAAFFLLALSISQAAVPPDKEQPPAKRQIFAIGGSGLEKAEGPPLLMEYFLGLTGKKKPRVCFMPSASGDAAAEIGRWNQVMKGLECEPRVQKVYIASPKVKSFEDELLKADAIYIGDGNALNMLAMWKAQGIDKILHQAYSRGIVLGGEGAGALCWFEQGLTNSRPGKLTPMDGLGFLKGGYCPNFDYDKNRRPMFNDGIKKGEIKEGLAADYAVGLHFVDEKLLKAVCTQATAQAYRVTRAGDKTVEATLKPELLAK